MYARNKERSGRRAQSKHTYKRLSMRHSLRTPRASAARRLNAQTPQKTNKKKGKLGFTEHWQLWSCFLFRDWFFGAFIPSNAAISLAEIGVWCEGLIPSLALRLWSFWTGDQSDLEVRAEKRYFVSSTTACVCWIRKARIYDPVLTFEARAIFFAL